MSKQNAKRHNEIRKALNSAILSRPEDAHDSVVMYRSTYREMLALGDGMAAELTALRERYDIEAGYVDLLAWACAVLILIAITGWIR